VSNFVDAGEKKKGKKRQSGSRQGHHPWWVEGAYVRFQRERQTKERKRNESLQKGEAVASKGS